MLLSEYRNMAEAKQQIGHFIDVVYSQKRIHSALDYKTPAEFETQWIHATLSNVQQFCVQKIRTTTFIDMRALCPPSFTRIKFRIAFSCVGR